VGQFRFKILFSSFVVSLITFFLTGCEKKYDTVINSVGDAPFASHATSSLSIINSDTINIGIERKPDDLITLEPFVTIKVSHPGGKQEISAVKYSVILDESSLILGEGFLHDDGVLPDQTADDSIYSGYAQIQFKRVTIGKLTLSIWSESQTGHISNTNLIPLFLVRLNHPPLISDLVAPNTISLSSINTFMISLKALDPDGQADIQSVLRFTPSGKILPLDAVNDSTYAEIVELVPRPDLGSYVFRFCAVDRSNDTSNILTTTIEITN
jgi:hypothetical protein